MWNHFARFFYIGWLQFFDDLLKKFDGPILGICSGMQILTSIFSISGLIDNVEIGMVEVKTLKPNKLFEGTFQAYNLHRYSVQDSEGNQVFSLDFQIHLRHICPLLFQ